jgi:copper(I)-binding protein
MTLSARTLPLILIAFAGLAACEPAKTPPAPMQAVATIDGVEISEPRLRVPPNGRDVTAGYLTLTNGSDKAQKLVGASSPKALRIELHAHLKGADGMAQMRQVQQVEIPAKGTAVLAPGGLHLMVFGIKEPLKPGDSFPVELTFDGSRKVGLVMPVVENPTQKTEGDKGSGGHQH